jgi:hypothetical protein
MLVLCDYSSFRCLHPPDSYIIGHVSLWLGTKVNYNSLHVYYADLI